MTTIHLQSLAINSYFFFKRDIDSKKIVILRLCVSEMQKLSWVLWVRVLTGYNHGVG